MEGTLGYGEADMEEILRFLLAKGAVSLLALPDLLNLPNNSETCHDLLMFMKARPKIFKLSKDDLGYKADLVEMPDVWDEPAGYPQGEQFSRTLTRPQTMAEAISGDQAGDSSTWNGADGLLSYLKSIILAADGSLPLASLQTDDACLARWTSLHGDGDFNEGLEAYLHRNPETFMVVPSSDGGAMVSLTPHMARAKPSGRWSKAHGSQAMAKMKEDRDVEVAED